MEHGKSMARLNGEGTFKESFRQFGVEFDLESILR